MMNLTPTRAAAVPLRGVALLVVILAGCAGTAISDESSTPSPITTTRAAVLATADATTAQVAAAARHAREAGARRVVVRRTGGLYEAQAQAAALGAEGYDEVIAVGAQARTAVGQAASSELGDGTRWTTSG
jgi:outer membrane murein-binding lipoprotein Lpp